MGSTDAQPNFIAICVYNGNRYIITDVDYFTLSSCDNQHCFPRDSLAFLGAVPTGM